MAGSKPSRENDIFDVERIRSLVELMEQHDLNEVDLRQNNQRIRLRRGADDPVVVSAGAIAQPAAVAAPSAPAATAAAAEDAGDIVVIKSPMVGTYYSKANPESDPLVKVGDSISGTSIVCIIEAMKVFNEIPAEVSGTIVAILVDNEEAVEFGKPLFKVDTSK